MAVNYLASCKGADGWASSVSSSITIPDAAGKIILVWVQGATAPTSVTYGGTALSLVDTKDSSFNSNKVRCYQLANPATGTANVVATYGTDGPITFVAQAFSGWDGNALTFAWYSASYLTVSTSIDVTVPSGGMAASVIFDHYSPTVEFTAAGGATRVQSFTYSTFWAFAGGYQADADTIGWAFSDEKFILHHAAIISPAGSGGGIDAVDACLHAHTSDNLTLTLSNSTDLVIAAIAHDHVSGALALTAVSTLAVADSGHAHSVDNVALVVLASIMLPPLRSWETGNLMPAETGITVWINDEVSGALVVKLAGQSSDATTAAMTITHASLVAGTVYSVRTKLASGAQHTWSYTAS